MREFRTKPLDPIRIREELSAFCELLRQIEITEVEVTLGWGCNIPNAQMWQSAAVPLTDIQERINVLEEAGQVEIGSGDVFLAIPGIELVLCHESDLHIRGDGSLFVEVLDRWVSQLLEPYEVFEKKG